MRILSSLAAALALLASLAQPAHAGGAHNPAIGGAAVPSAQTTPATAKSDAPTTIKATAKPADTAAKPGTPKAAIITCGDRKNGEMVGIYMVASTLKEAVPVLEKELGTDGSGVVVIRIFSGGGLGLEVPRIHEVLEKEYKTRWRTVAWIESAISAAAMSAHVFEEIYFTSQGNYGACTGFYGSLDRPVEGLELEKSLAEMEVASRKGGYNTLIMRAMQIQMPLSATIDADGKVTYYADTTSGEILVNRPTEILTFNAKSAARVKFSRGTADTLEELTKLMGYEELHWVGEEIKGYPYPISRAEKMQMDFRKQVKEDEERTREYFATMNMNISAAQGVPRDERGPFIGRARNAITRIENMVKNNPNFSFMVFNANEKQFKELVAEWRKVLRDLMK